MALYEGDGSRVMEYNIQSSTTSSKAYYYHEALNVVIETILLGSKYVNVEVGKFYLYILNHLHRCLYSEAWR